jgi:hypothetical protein
MKVLLYSGLLYLAGVAIVLILQPSLMFTEDGIWKEFGIGRSPSTHTWLPFWLFAIVWAILSYIIILMIARVLPGVEIPASVRTASESRPVPLETGPSISYKNFEPMPKTRGKRANSLIPGYYILNREATELAGAPKYIYLGAEAPGLENQGPGLDH